MNKSEEKNEILAAFALGALDKDEARQFAVQIEKDHLLAAETGDWQNLAANLAFSVAPAEPAPELRAKILSAIRATPQLSDSSQTVFKNSQDAAGKNKQLIATAAQTAPEKPEKAAVLNFPARSKTSFWRFVPAFGAVAASVAALLLGISLYHVSQSDNAKTEQIARLNQKVFAAEEKIIDVQTQLERERQERELLASPATFIKALDGTKEFPTAKARFVFDPKTGQSLLYVEGLPAAPPGKAYQIWFISDPKHPAPGKTFGTDNNGKGVLREQIPVQDRKALIFAVTLEPESGSLAPTTSPLLISAVS